MATCVCTTCNCDPCTCGDCCTNCGCNTCDGDCTDPKYAPIKECVPEMIKPSFALGIDCDRRKRKIANKVKSLLSSNGNTVKFRDGSEDDRIALALIEKAVSDSVVMLDGSGQLQKTTPTQDGIDYWLGYVDNVLGFHEAPDNSNSFLASTVENRECGPLALIICDASGRAKLAKWSACEVAAGETKAIHVDENGYPVCAPEAEETVVEEVQSTCKPDLLIPQFLPTPSLVVDKWPGLPYPAADGTSGTDNGSFNIPANLPDHKNIKRLILYIEAGSFHQISGNYRDLFINVNNERVHYHVGAVDQIGSSAAAGTGGSATESTAVHDGSTLDSAATWNLGTNIVADYFWKFRLYVKGAYYDHCDYGHSEEAVS